MGTDKQTNQRTDILITILSSCAPSGDEENIATEAFDHARTKVSRRHYRNVIYIPVRRDCTGVLRRLQVLFSV